MGFLACNGFGVGVEGAGEFVVGDLFIPPIARCTGLGLGEGDALAGPDVGGGPCLALGIKEEEGIEFDLDGGDDGGARARGEFDAGAGGTDRGDELILAGAATEPAAGVSAGRINREAGV